WPTLRSSTARARSGWVTLYVPALPQHQSASASGMSSSSGIAARSARGCSRTFWPCRRRSEERRVGKECRSGVERRVLQEKRDEADVGRTCASGQHLTSKNEAERA